MVSNQINSHSYQQQRHVLPPNEVMYVIFPVSGVGDLEGDLLALNWGIVGEAWAA